MIRVRDARPEDADAWRAIILETSQEDESGIITHPGEVWPVDVFVARLRDLRAQEQAFLVAELEGMVVGSLGLTRGARVANRHTAEIGITVRGDKRGLGVGSALMRAAEERAREWGVRKICLGVFVQNEGARRLYRRLGYEEEGVRRGQFLMPRGLMDEVLMAKWVGE